MVQASVLLFLHLCLLAANPCQLPHSIFHRKAASNVPNNLQLDRSILAADRSVKQHPRPTYLYARQDGQVGYVRTRTPEYRLAVHPVPLELRL